MAAPSGSSVPSPAALARVAELVAKLHKTNIRFPLCGTPRASIQLPMVAEAYIGSDAHPLAHKLATVLSGFYLDKELGLHMLEKDDPLFLAQKNEFYPYMPVMVEYLKAKHPDELKAFLMCCEARHGFIANFLPLYNRFPPVKIEDAPLDDQDAKDAKREMGFAAALARAESKGNIEAAERIRKRQEAAFEEMAAKEREAQRNAAAAAAHAKAMAAEAHKRQVDAVVKAANDAMAAVKAAASPPPSAAAVAVTPAPAYAPSVQSVSFKVATPAAPAMVPASAGRAQSSEDRKKMIADRLAASAKAAKDQARAVDVGGGVIMASKADALDVNKAVGHAPDAIVDRLAADMGTMRLGSILSRAKNSETGQLNPEHVQKEARQAKNQAQSDYKHVVAQYDGTFANLGKNSVAMPAGMFPVFCESVAAYAPAQLYVITDETGDDIPVVLSAVFERMRSIGKLSKSGAYDGQEKRRVRVYGSSIPEDVVALNCDTYRILGGQSKGGKDLAKQYERSIRRCLKTYHIESQRNVHASMAAGAANASVLPGNR